jgi:hypothetical protein
LVTFIKNAVGKTFKKDDVGRILKKKFIMKKERCD